MDIVNAASSRAAFYDRNATALTVGFLVGPIGPHGATVRDSYTVPAGRKTIINAIDIVLLRTTATAAGPQVQSYYTYIPNGGVDQIIIFNSILLGTVGDRASNQLGLEFVMYPGDELTITTGDASAGGGVFYSNHAMITEFDF